MGSCAHEFKRLYKVRKMTAKAKDWAEAHMAERAATSAPASAIIAVAPTAQPPAAGQKRPPPNYVT